MGDESDSADEELPDLSCLTLPESGEGSQVAEAGTWEDLLQDGRLLKRVLLPGHGSALQSGAAIEVNYETFLVDHGGKKIESTKDRQETFSFTLGEGDVLEAWDIAVATMLPGETCEIIATADLAYGEAGAGEIPPLARLRFVIELLKPGRHVQTTVAKSLRNEPLPECDEGALTKAVEAKDSGNTLVKAGDLRGARKAYLKALELGRGVHAHHLVELKGRQELILSCLLNLAHCALKLEEFRDALKQCGLALEVDPRSSKAHYRRGLSHMGLKEWKSARLDLLEAAKLDPRSVEVRTSLEECRRRLAADEHTAKESLKGLFKSTSPVESESKSSNVTRDLQRLPQAWMDVQIGGSKPHRVTFALYDDAVPRTVSNFLALCTGDYGLGKCGQPLHYKRTRVHKVIKGFMMEAGDIENYDGTGGESIYGGNFADEDFEDAHVKRGLLSMANAGPDTNNSRFIVTFRPLESLDGRHVVFGEIISGMYVLDAIEALETDCLDRPCIQVAIVDCGRQA